MNSEIEQLLSSDIDDGEVITTNEVVEQPATPEPEAPRVIKKPEVVNKPNQQQSKPSRIADPSLFKKSQPTGMPGNPARVSVCKAQIDRFNHECRRTAENHSIRASATSGLYNTFRSLDTMNRDDVHEVLDYLVKVIRSSTTGAFDRTIVFANMCHLRESERDVMTRMLHLVTVFAETKNPDAFRRRVDPAYILEVYKSEQTRLNIDSYFPGK